MSVFEADDPVSMELPIWISNLDQKFLFHISLEK